MNKQSNNFFNGLLLLQTIFIILKVTGAIEWGWAAVLSPLIAMACILFLFVVLLLLAAFFIAVCKEYKK